MKKDIPELPEKAGFIKQILHCIATRLGNIEDKISQPTSEQDNSELLTKIKEFEQANQQLQATLQDSKIQNQQLMQEVTQLKELQKQQPNIDIEHWLTLQKKVRQDDELANLFWGSSTNDTSTQFIRFIAKAGEWDQVIKIWDLLASRCKADQRSATDQEQLILEQILAIHNLTSFRLQASLSSCDIGTRYDYKKMERGNPTGDSVQAIWLPGLVNAGGTSVKNVLVKTQ